MLSPRLPALAMLALIGCSTAALPISQFDDDEEPGARGDAGTGPTPPLGRPDAGTSLGSRDAGPGMVPGFPLFDGGTFPRLDGGLLPPGLFDGGLPLFDGSFPFSDSGRPRLDGGFPLPDGGPRPFDAGFPIPDAGPPTDAAPMPCAPRNPPSCPAAPPPTDTCTLADNGRCAYPRPDGDAGELAVRTCFPSTPPVVDWTSVQCSRNCFAEIPRAFEELRTDDCLQRSALIRCEEFLNEQTAVDTVLHLVAQSCGLKVHHLGLIFTREGCPRALFARELGDPAILCIGQRLDLLRFSCAPLCAIANTE